MKRILVCSVVAFGLASTAVFGGKRDPDVDKALKSVYPDAQTEVTGSHEVNGVKVNDVKVMTKEGESSAAVTEYGDFLYYGLPRTKNINPNIAKSISGLFKGVGDNMEVNWATNYLVDVTASNKKQYRLRLDATGRLKDIQNDAEVKRDNERTPAKGDTGKIKGMAEKYMDGAKVEKVYEDASGESFYLAEVKNKNGEKGLITLNNDGQIYMKRWDIQKDDIPEPVLKTIGDMFDQDKVKITQAYRSDFEYYQFDTSTSAGDQVVVRIRPNGDIMSVTNAKAAAEEEAVTAKAKQDSSRAPKTKAKAAN